jgi:hypothetical protein
MPWKVASIVLIKLERRSYPIPVVLLPEDMAAKYGEDRDNTVLRLVLSIAR